MTITIQTPLLVVGSGPGALVVAKLAGAHGIGTLLVGHALHDDEEPATLSAEAIGALTPTGLFDILRPFLAPVDTVAIAPAAFEEVVKHHCVVDVNVTVYDGMELLDAQPHGEGGTSGVLTDGRSRWEIVADRYVDATHLPTTLSDAVVAATATVERLVG